MLNKIKLIGKFLPTQIKEQSEREVDNTDSALNETTNDFDNPEKEKREPLFYFSLSVINPSCSKTILRCVAYGEIAKKIEKENQEIAKDEEVVVEVRGYLRNEKQKNELKDGRQILIRVLEFNRLDLNFNDIDKKNSNQVRLLGKIITDLQAPQDKPNLEVLSFKLAVPREGNKSPLFFCRAQGELIPEIKGKLKKGDIILLEGFLQTKILQTKEIEGGMDEKIAVNPARASSIICRGFTFLDNDSVSVFSPLDNLTRIVKEVREIDYSQPKN